MLPQVRFPAANEAELMLLKVVQFGFPVCWYLTLYMNTPEGAVQFSSAVVAVTLLAFRPVGIGQGAVQARVVNVSVAENGLN